MILVSRLYSHKNFPKKSSCYKKKFLDKQTFSWKNYQVMKKVFLNFFLIFGTFCVNIFRFMFQASRPDVGLQKQNFCREKSARKHVWRGDEVIFRPHILNYISFWIDLEGIKMTLFALFNYFLWDITENKFLFEKNFYAKKAIFSGIFSTHLESWKHMRHV